MFKNRYIIIGTIAVILTVGLGVVYVVWQQNRDNFVNFRDPSLTNSELATIEGKIRELESSVTAREKSEDINNDDKKSDLFKVKMELASYYRLRGRLLDAKQQILGASKLKPDNISPWNELYAVEYSRMDFKAAQAALDKSLSISDNNVQAWRWYVELAEGSLGYDKVKLDNLYMMAIEKTKGNGELLVIYSRYLEKNNDLAGAVAQLKKAIAINPDGTELYQAEITRIQNQLK